MLKFNMDDSELGNTHYTLYLVNNAYPWRHLSVILELDTPTPPSGFSAPTTWFPAEAAPFSPQHQALPCVQLFFSHAPHHLYENKK